MKDKETLGNLKIEGDIIGSPVLTRQGQKTSEKDEELKCQHGKFYDGCSKCQYERIKMAVLAEREACANICDIPPDVEDRDIIGGEVGAELCRLLAARIRMRSNLM